MNTYRIEIKQQREWKPFVENEAEGKSAKSALKKAIKRAWGCEPEIIEENVTEYGGILSADMGEYLSWFSVTEK